MAIQKNRTQILARLFLPLALLVALLSAPPASSAQATAEDAPVETSAFSKWELSINGDNFFLRAACLNNHAILLQFANTFERKIAVIPETFAITLEPADRDLFKFDEGDYETCEIFVDGIGYQAHAARQSSAIAIRDKSLFNALLASGHEQFVISFPELAISYTFPLEGLKNAFNRVKYLHLQIEIADHAKAMKIFSWVASIGILLAAGGAICWFLYSAYRKKLRIPDFGKSKSREKPVGGEKAKKQAGKSGQSSRKSGASRERRTSSAYDYRANHGFDEKTRDDFYERANFGNPFGSSAKPAGIPSEVRKSLEFFGLPETSTLAEIRDKRTFLLKACHPDRFQGDEGARKMAEEQTKKINYNFDVLARYYKKF